MGAAFGRWQDDRRGADWPCARSPPTPKFAAEASQWLAGKPATDDSFDQAGELAKKVASPITDMRGTAEYRTHLVGILVKRTLARAVERALEL